MSAKDTNTPAEPQEPVANIDWAALLSDEDIKSLAGFFDTLIEMDFEAKQRNEQRGKDENTHQTTTNDKPSAT
jgi:cytochrome c553